MAHNSGDSIDAAKEALEKGADVIEIDVVSIGETLYAGHDSPLPFVGKRFFRGPRLADIWPVAARAEVVKLDLKERSRAYLDRLIASLEQRPGTVVIVATHDLRSLEVFRERYPDAIRLWSVHDRQRFERIQQDPAIQALIDGVTIRHTVVDEEVGRWLEENGYITLAWTVNDAKRMNELVRLGVDAITTDNLAIMQLLGGQQRDEGRLTRPESAAQTRQE